MLLLALRLERMDAPLLLYDGRRHWRLLVPRAIAAIAVASAAVAPTAPLLFTVALGTRLLSLRAGLRLSLGARL